MTQDIEYIASLIRKHFREELSDSEKMELDVWLNSSPANRAMFEEVNNAEYISGSLKKWDGYNQEGIAAKIAERIPVFRLKEASEPAALVHRVHFLKTAWFKYAAAIILLFGIGSYLYITNQKEKPSVTQINPLPVQTDVAPGGNKAILTLADGSKIILDSIANGTIAKENQVSVIKSADGKIEYRVSENRPDVVAYNTMSTPRGGQYQLTLPDGSQVWLNAASSITYPTMFTVKTREVSVSGEVYFEVARNKRQPFIVTAGKQTIEVLGTHFNVNSYNDENTLNTTLLEGSVRIKSVHTSLILKPGQQGQFNPRNENLSLAVNPDVEQAVAWKNGYFHLQGLTLDQAMRQLARWYDIEIQYEGSLPSLNFYGKIQRSLTLQQALKVLSGLGVDLKLVQGRKLIVTKSAPK